MAATVTQPRQRTQMKSDILDCTQSILVRSTGQFRRKSGPKAGPKLIRCFINVFFVLDSVIFHTTVLYCYFFSSMIESDRRCRPIVAPIFRMARLTSVRIYSLSLHFPPP